MPHIEYILRVLLVLHVTCGLGIDAQAGPESDTAAGAKYGTPQQTASVAAEPVGTQASDLIECYCRSHIWQLACVALPCIQGASTGHTVHSSHAGHIVLTCALLTRT